jgi:hypothetical protein
VLSSLLSTHSQFAVDPFPNPRPARLCTVHGRVSARQSPARISSAKVAHLFLPGLDEILPPSLRTIGKTYKAKPKIPIVPVTPAQLAEMTMEALNLYRPIFKRALELTHGDAAAQDLVQSTYLAFVAKPPTWGGPTRLKHWLRSVVLNMHRKVLRGRGDTEVVSWDILHGWDG